MIELIRVNTPQQWAAYHDIRRTVLFEERGKFFSGDYSENHPDDRRAENHGLLLIEDGQPRGAMRLDFYGDGLAVVRTVAIEVGQQRRGLGSAMMGLVEAYATARAVVVLEVNSAPDAVAFYQRLDWLMIDPLRESPLLRKRLNAER
ncbi:MAG TPA: GNAT family N-acetyltransferase [Caulobacteraceae bacterium]|nr:GNAT family N-acetyltransferase [Caulobacteraceae bacterium]